MLYVYTNILAGALGAAVILMLLDLWISMKPKDVAALQNGVMVSRHDSVCILIVCLVGHTRNDGRGWTHFL